MSEKLSLRKWCLSREVRGARKGVGYVGMWGKVYLVEGMAHAKAVGGLSLVVFEDYLEEASIVRHREVKTEGRRCRRIDGTYEVGPCLASLFRDQALAHSKHSVNVTYHL